MPEQAQKISSKRVSIAVHQDPSRRRVPVNVYVDGNLMIDPMYAALNYIDRRFTGGGYHMLTKTQTTIGVGLNVGYLMSDNWSIYAGFNTAKKFQLGVRWFPFDTSGQYITNLVR